MKKRVFSDTEKNETQAFLCESTDRNQLNSTAKLSHISCVPCEVFDRDMRGSSGRWSWPRPFGLFRFVSFRFDQSFRGGRA